MLDVQQDHASESKDCPYRKICKLYEPDQCHPDEYLWSDCWVFTIFEGILRDDIEIIEYRSKSIKEIIEANNEN